MSIILTIIISSITFVLGLFLGIFYVKNSVKKQSKQNTRVWAKVSQSYRDEQIGLNKEILRLKTDLTTVAKLVSDSYVRIEEIIKR